MLKNFWTNIREKLKHTQSNNNNSNQHFLREQMAQVRHQLTIAETEFDLLPDETLLEPLIYRIKALNLQYSRLLGLARQENSYHHSSNIREKERIGGRMG